MSTQLQTDLRLRFLRLSIRLLELNLNSEFKWFRPYAHSKINREIFFPSLENSSYLAYEERRNVVFWHSGIVTWYSIMVFYREEATWVNILVTESIGVTTYWGIILATSLRYLLEICLDNSFKKSLQCNGNNYCTHWTQQIQRCSSRRNSRKCLE